MEITLFKKVLTTLDTSFDTIVTTNVPSLITGIAPVFSGAFSILVAMIFFNYWLNPDGFANFMDLVKRMMVWAFLIGLAFNAPAYAQLSKMVYGLGDSLASYFQTGAETKGSTLFDTTLQLFFDSILKVNEVADKYIDENSNFFTGDVGLGQQFYIRILLGLYAVVVMLAATLILVATFSTYVFAKLGLILVLAVGPLFIAFALFSQTRTYAMNWVGQLLNFTVLVVMIAIMNGIIFALVKGQMDDMANQIASIDWLDLMKIIFMMMLQIIIMAVLCYLFIGQLPSLVSALTGGNAGTSGMGAISSTVRFGNSAGKMASGISAFAQNRKDARADKAAGNPAGTTAMARQMGVRSAAERALSKGDSSSSGGGAK